MTEEAETTTDLALKQITVRVSQEEWKMMKVGLLDLGQTAQQWFREAIISQFGTHRIEKGQESY